MVQSKTSICLLKLFLLSLTVVACVFVSEAVASAFVPTDIERDLEEIQFLHNAELQFLAQLEPQTLLDINDVGDIECQLYGRSQSLGFKSNLNPRPARSLKTTELDLSVDASPAPRPWVGVGSKPSSAALSANAKIDTIATRVLSATNSEQVDVPTYHQQVFNRRLTWKAASEFVVTERKRLVETAGLTGQKVEGVCRWAGERIAASQIQVASGSFRQPGAVEASHSLAAIATVEIPMFLVPGNDVSGSIGAKLKSPDLAMPIPMFEVAIVDQAVADGKQSLKAAATELDTKAQAALLEPPVSANIPMFLVDDVATELPKDLFVGQNRPTVSVLASSIKLQRPARDPYWQYYEDCDRWGVVIVEAQPLQATAATSGAQKRAESSDDVEDANHPVALGAKALLFQIISSNSELLLSYSLTPQRKLVVDPLEQVLRSLIDHGEGPRQLAVLVPAQPLNPLLAAVLINKPLSERLGIGSLELASLLNAKALSCQICELQNQYADRIDGLAARSLAMEASQRKKSLGFVAAQCRRLAKTLDRFADSISAADDIAQVAQKGEPTSKK